MKRLVNNTLFGVSISIIVLLSNPLSAQNVSGFQYINPLPNSHYISINSNVIIRQGSVICESSINDNLIEAIGTKSGIHTGKIILANDSRTIIFTPFAPFQTDEDVIVNLKAGLLTAAGDNVGELTFKFRTCKNANTIIKEDAPADYRNVNISSKFSSVSVADTTLPSNLPRVTINTSNNPSPGYFFLPASPFLEIVDNEGTPVFYRKVNGHIYNFDLQLDGELTYFIYPISCYGFDSSFNYVRTFTTINGYTVDVHDLRVLSNGSYYIFGKMVVEMDMSKIVNGGDTTAQIITGALQQFDSQGNLIFQWDALSHYNITDVDSEINLTQHAIDFSHFNAVEIDNDGHLLISARNLDEITKVDHITGDIIWRWGGKNNQFIFINDNLGFSRQHHVRRLSNGDISLFDNGVFHPTPMSSAVEYNLDEINMTSTLVRRIYHNNIFTSTEGSVQEMPNGNRVISWGHNWNPVVTEVKPDNSIAFDLSYRSFIDTYKAFKYQWKTNLFTTNTDSLNFGKITLGDSLIKQFTVYNPHDSAVTINEFFCSDSSFTTNVKVPITIQPKDSLVVPVTLKPARNGTFTVSFNIRNIGQNGYQQMIARQVILLGTTLLVPVELVSFTRSIGEGEVLLEWRTATELNNYGFEIQRKFLSGDFTAVEFIKGNGTTTQQNQYSFTDKNLVEGKYFYRLKQMDYDGQYNYSPTIEVEVRSLDKYTLEHNYPNPFNPKTTIGFSLREKGNVKLSIHNILGEEVRVLLNEEEEAGYHSTDFIGNDLPSGVYFYRIQSGSFLQTRKLILLR